MNAHAVLTIVGVCSSSYSTLATRTSTRATWGRRSVAMAASRNVAQARPSVTAGDPVTASTAAPTAPPMPPAMTVRRARRELAPTSWSGSSTSAGTRAWRTTPDALADTSRARAKKYSARSSRAKASAAAQMARSTKRNTAIQRWPNRNRSMAGPISGASRANGAMLISR